MSIFRRVLIPFFLALPAVCFGQAQAGLPLLTGTGRPTSVCSGANVHQAWLDTSDATNYQTCGIDGLWHKTPPVSQGGTGASDAAQALVNLGASSSSAPAGGDLSGTYPNPTVNKVNGAAVPSSANFLGTNATGQPVVATGTSLSKLRFAADTGTAQAHAVALSPAITSNASGTEVFFIPLATNTATAPTLAVNGLAALPITVCGTIGALAGDLATTTIADVVSDGTNWQLKNPAITNCGSVVATLQAGTGVPLAGAVINATQSNVGTATQINVQNTSSDNAASSDLVATADNGTNSTNFLDCGVNSSTYNVAGYNTGGADDGYCYATGNLNLAAAGSGKSVTINAGGTTTAQTIATFSAGKTLLIGESDGVAVGAGYVGQVISSCIVRGSGTALTSASTINFLTLSLTAGDWDVEGNVNLVGAALTATNGNFANSITTTSATVNTDGSEVLAPTLTMTTWTGYNTVTLPRKVINVSATTSTYLVVNFQGTITSGTGTLWGCMTARRVH